MISSESINYSKYSTISDNINQRNDLEILEITDVSENNKNEEGLSKKLINQNPKSNEKNSDNKSNDQISDLIYGNPYNELKPKYIGKCLALYFDKNGNPRITIGPDCKLNIVNY